MKPRKTDIDFLIDQKKRAGEVQPEDERFELPGNLSSDNFEPQGELPDSDIDLFSKKIAESQVPALDEEQVPQNEIDTAPASTAEDHEALKFDINDALILPEFKKETPLSEENDQTIDFADPKEILELSSNEASPFILESSLEEREENLDDIQLQKNEIETVAEDVFSKVEESEETLSFEIESQIQLEDDSAQEANPPKQELANQKSLFSEEIGQEPKKEERPAEQKKDAPLTLGKKSVLQDFITQKTSQKEEPFRTAKRSQKPQEKPKKQSALKTSIPLSSLIENSSLVGLDIGTHSVKYAQLKKTVRGLQVMNFGNFPIPDSPTGLDDKQRKQLLSESLRKNFENRPFKNTLITSAVYGLKVLFKNIQVPKTAQKELAKAVPWACRKDLPFPVESTLFEYQQIENKNKSAEQLDIFVVAAQKELVSSHIETLKEAKITPAKVSTIPVALWNLCKETMKKESNKCFGLIDIGSSSSHILFIKKGQLEFARQISTGAGDFTEALTGAIFVNGEEIGLDAKRAESIKRKYGFPDESSDATTKEGIPLKELSALMGPVLEKLVSEIQRTIEFFKEKFDVDALESIYLTGGGALMTNLIPRLSRELNLNIEVLNPFKFVSFKKLKEKPDWNEMGPRFAVSIGLALDRKKEFNLLPKELKGSHAFQYLKKIFRYGFIIAILAMALMSQNVTRQFKKIQQEFKRISTEYEAVKPRREKFLSLQRELKKLNVTLQSHSDKLDINLNTTNHLRALSHLVPRNIAFTSLKVSYDKLKVEGSDTEYQTRELLLITGVAFENNSMEGVNLAKFLLDLEKSNYFYTIDLKSQRIREDGGLEFTIECEV